MNVFLTGGTGFIGSNLLEQLIKNNISVSCTIRNDGLKVESPLVKRVRCSLGDLSNPQVACELVKGHDCIIHCAAIRGEMGLPWSEYYKVNVESTATLLKAARKHSIKKFIYLSSVGVLGTMPSQLPANEETPYQPDSYYHKSKMLAEQEVMRFSREFGLNSVVIRPSVTYGPRDNGFFRRVTRIAAGGVFPVVSGGKNIIHLTYIDGLVDAIIKSLYIQTQKKVNVYTIVDSTPIYFRTLIELIASSLNKRVRLVNIPSGKLLLLGCKISDNLLSPIKKGLSLTMSAKILALPWYYSSQKAQGELSYNIYDTRQQVPLTVEWLCQNEQINN